MLKVNIYIGLISLTGNIDDFLPKTNVRNKTQKKKPRLSEDGMCAFYWPDIGLAT